MNIHEELLARGLVADCTDTMGLLTRMASGPITLYCGFDPTADSLHVESGSPAGVATIPDARPSIPLRWRVGHGFDWGSQRQDQERQLLTREVFEVEHCLGENAVGAVAGL
jgi:tyrosyl-tRNA synthetase